jgi:hypothetical protein
MHRYKKNKFANAFRLINFSRHVLLLLATLLLNGCFEVNSEAEFKENGEVLLTVELAVSAELMAIISHPNFSEKRETELDFISDCETPRTATIPGIRSLAGKLGQKSGMFTCTMTIDFSDPVLAYQHSRTSPEFRKGPFSTFSIERLGDKEGYRIRGTIEPPKLTSSQESNQMADAMLVAMLANRFFTISMKAQRFENTNGDLQNDNQQVTWKIPLISLFSNRTQVPIRIEADVIYAESFISRWIRKLFG